MAVGGERSGAAGVVLDGDVRWGGRGGVHEEHLLFEDPWFEGVGDCFVEDTHCW